MTDRQYIKILQELLATRDLLLDAIPENKEHGKCVYCALEWIEKKKKPKKISHERIRNNERDT